MLGEPRLHGATALLLATALLAATCRDAGHEPDMQLPLIDLTPAEVSPALGSRSYAHADQLVQFGPRFTGSPGWAKALEYISNTLRQTTGREPVRDRWTDPVHGVTFENIHLTIRGRSPHRIVLAAHHDTKKCEGHPDPDHNFHFVGANDSGSGVGLLLALAEELATQRHEATLQFVFFDGEECLDFDWDSARPETKALFGSRRFVAAERERELAGDQDGAIKAMVLLDMVGAKDLQIDLVTNSDPNLRDIIRSAAHACGHQKVFFGQSHAVRDDHVPFLDAGIPAIDLIDLKDNPQWHTADDTMEHISADSLKLVGEVVLTALPAIEHRFVRTPGDLVLPSKR